MTCLKRSGSTPSATQNSLNARPIDVVSTPPKSTSRPRLGIFDQLQRAAAERGDAFLQLGEERVVGDAGEMTRVRTLQQHRELPHGEDGVERDVAHRSAGPL